MAVLNTWQPASNGQVRDQLEAFVQCDFCLPARAMPGSAADLRHLGWRFDELESGPHRCPICPPGSPNASRIRLSAPSESPALPNLIIIGAGKAGTTALHDYLDLHPEIAMAPDKELNFFVDPECGRRIDEYASFFDGGRRLRGESTPWYTADPIAPGVPERVSAAVPDARLVYLVRDPVARALAEYSQYAAVWGQIRIEDAFGGLGDAFDRFTALGLYAHQLECYFDVFPPEQILVVDQADLLSDRRNTLREVFRFVGADPAFVSDRFDELINTTVSRRRITGAWRLLRGSRAAGLIKQLPPTPREMLLGPARRLLSRPPAPTPEATPELRARLRTAFAGDVARLRELTGMQFSSWQL